MPMVQLLYNDTHDEDNNGDDNDDNIMLPTVGPVYRE